MASRDPEFLSTEGLARNRADLAALEAKMAEVQATVRELGSNIRVMRSAIALQEKRLRELGLLEPPDPMEGLDRYPRGQRGVVRAMAELPSPVDVQQLLARAQETDAIDPHSTRGADVLRATLHRLAKKGLVERHAEGWALTEEGSAYAWELTEPIIRELDPLDNGGV